VAIVLPLRESRQAHVRQGSINDRPCAVCFAPDGGLKEDMAGCE
jgi:hypothetical protein